MSSHRSSGNIIKFTDEKRKELQANAFARLMRAFRDAGGEGEPTGWTVVARQRETGVSKGDIDYQYYGPDGKRYRSQREAVNQMLTEMRAAQAQAAGGDGSLPPAPALINSRVGRDNPAKLHPDGFEPIEGKRRTQRPDYSLVKRRKRSDTPTKQEDGSQQEGGGGRSSRHPARPSASPAPADPTTLSGCSYSLGSRASQLFRELGTDANTEVSDYGPCMLAWRLARAAQRHDEAVGLRARFRADKDASAAVQSALGVLAGAAGSLEGVGGAADKESSRPVLVGEDQRVMAAQEQVKQEPTGSHAQQAPVPAAAPVDESAHELVATDAGGGVPDMQMDSAAHVTCNGPPEAGVIEQQQQAVPAGEPAASAVITCVDMSEQEPAHGPSGDGEGEGEGEQPAATLEVPRNTAAGNLKDAAEKSCIGDAAPEASRPAGADVAGVSERGRTRGRLNSSPDAAGGTAVPAPASRAHSSTPSLRRRYPRVATTCGEDVGQQPAKRVTRAAAAGQPTPPPSSGMAGLSKPCNPQKDADVKARQQESQQEPQQPASTTSTGKPAAKRSRHEGQGPEADEVEQVQGQGLQGQEEPRQLGWEQGKGAEDQQAAQQAQLPQPQQPLKVASTEESENESENADEQDAALVLAEGLAVAYRRRKLRTQEVAQRHAAHLLRSIVPSMGRMMKVVQGLQAAGVTGDVFQDFTKAVRRMRGAVKLLTGVPHVVELAQGVGRPAGGNPAAGVAAEVTPEHDKALAFDNDHTGGGLEMGGNSIERTFSKEAGRAVSTQPQEDQDQEEAQQGQAAGQPEVGQNQE